MLTTPNLGLKKPEGTDTVDIDILNGNMDTLDGAVAAKETPAGAQSKVDAHVAAADPHPQYALDTALNSYVPTTQKGAVNGVASLGGDGKVPASQLNVSTAADKITITDAGAHFTATDVEGALNELFQNADNAQRSIANVVGSPTVAGDTYTKISSDIQAQKNNLAANLTKRAQSATGSETLKSLVDKTGIINGTILTASDTTVASSNGVTSTNLTDKQKLKEILIGGDGSGIIRVVFDMEEVTSGTTASGQVYKNGSPYGTNRTSTTSGGTYLTFTEDLRFNAGDLVQLFAASAAVKNFHICVTACTPIAPPPFTVNL